MMTILIKINGRKVMEEISNLEYKWLRDACNNNIRFVKLNKIYYNLQMVEYWEVVDKK